jgi:hypothetical protein
MVLGQILDCNKILPVIRNLVPFLAFIIADTVAALPKPT